MTPNVAHGFLTARINANWSTESVDQYTLIDTLILPTSETLGVKTVYPRELVMKFKVIYNVVSNNFYFD